VNPRERTSLSKFLSLVLRHEPQVLGLTIDRSGWVFVDELLDKCRLHGKEISRTVLDEIVATSPKQRFAFSEDGLRIRANQGHTISRFLESIRSAGLLRMERHHVHLSGEVETALAVGRRRGEPVVLRVRARQMHEENYTFYRSENGVWLTEHVPVRYIDFLDDT
jgi:putative RNA 2'-phosphotransferase